MKRARGKRSCQGQRRDVQTDWISRVFQLVREHAYYEICQSTAGEGVVPPIGAVDVHGREILPVSPALARLQGYEQKYRVLCGVCGMCSTSFSLRSGAGGSVSWKGARMHLKGVHGVTDFASMEVVL